MGREKNALLFWIGIGIIVFTHIYMILYGLPSNQMTGHVVSNFVGAGLILLSVE